MSLAIRQSVSENPVRELARRYHSEDVMTISRTVAMLKAMNVGHRSKNIPFDGLREYTIQNRVMATPKLRTMTMPGIIRKNFDRALPTIHMR